MIAENKWRAIKDGVKGKLIDFGKQTEVSVSELASELIELVDDVLDRHNLLCEVVSEVCA